MEWGLRIKNLILWRFTEKSDFKRGFTKKTIHREIAYKGGLDSLRFKRKRWCF